MRKQQRVALVCAGPVSRSGLARLPGIRDQLMWVKSSTPSAASRAANMLGGKPVREYIEMRSAAVVLLRAPDSAVDGAVAELLSSGLDWTDRTVVLFENNLDSTALSPLSEAGAHAASLNQLDTPAATLLLEGTAEARKRVRRLLRGGGQRVIELDQGAKVEYFAGVRLGTTAFVPLMAETIDHFVRAGLTKASAEQTASSLFESSMRAYLRAGKRLLRSGSPLRY